MTASSLRLLLALALGVAARAARAAFAQDEEEPEASPSTTDPLTADFKGMIGLGLIGAELGFVVPALAGARDTWVYIVFPVLGAGGGAVGGLLPARAGRRPPRGGGGRAHGRHGAGDPRPGRHARSHRLRARRPRRRAATATAARGAAGAAAGPGLVRWSERGVVLAPPAIARPTIGQRKEALRTGVDAREQRAGRAAVRACSDPRPRAAGPGA